LPRFFWYWHRKCIEDTHSGKVCFESLVNIEEERTVRIGIGLGTLLLIIIIIILLT
jgi:hypothetical protein